MGVAGLSRSGENLAAYTTGFELGRAHCQHDGNTEVEDLR
jgi:hypothetical protein